MKPKNFPARKLKRQIVANGEQPKDFETELHVARETRTKIDRSKRGKNK